MKPVCIAIVDSAHARIYSYQGDPPVFREMNNLINPSRRAKDGELFSSTRPGIRNVGGTDDHRKDHRAHWDREFAKQIIDECLELTRTRGYAHVIFVSSPRMLGELRSVSEPLRKSCVLIDELERDLAGLTSPQIHDRLADAHLIDPRARAR
ncbi:MAG: host attachment protein [Deltaproteobacteria bacterium]|nr:host attachment protein [Deltaproteobacteria bacterium]